MSWITANEPMSNGMALRKIDDGPGTRFTLGPEVTKTGDVVYYFTEAELLELAETIQRVTS